MSSCDSECICCCLPCIVGWACIYFTYAGVRRFGRYCHGKCYPEAPQPESSQGQRVGDQNEKGGPHGHSNPVRQSYTSKHRSQDLASSMTQIQEPEKAYATIKTQPSPIQGMSTKSPSIPPQVKTDFSSNNNTYPTIPLPSPTWSSQDTRSFRHETDTRTAHTIEQNDDAASYTRSPLSGQELSPPKP